MKGKFLTIKEVIELTGLSEYRVRKIAKEYQGKGTMQVGMSGLWWLHSTLFSQFIAKKQVEF